MRLLAYSHMIVRLGILAWVAASACGRVGFAVTPDASVPSVFTPVALPPGGTLIDAVVAADGTVYIAGEQIVARSTDQGATWSACGGTPLQVETIALDASGNIYLATEQTVVVSSDGCATWRDLQFDAGPNVVAVAGTRVLAGTDDGLYAYDGTAWTQVAQASLAGQPITDIAVSSDGQNVYVATGGYQTQSVGLACSSDAGTTFALCNTGLDGSSVDFVVVDGANAMRAFAQVGTPQMSYGLFSTSDGGASWQVADGSNGGNTVGIDPSADTFVLWDTWGVGLETSSDGGGSFDGSDHRSASMFETVINRLAYGSASQVYAATSRGMFTSTNHQLLWTEVDAGLATWDVYAIAVGPDGTIYLATPAGVLRSSDDGGSWTEATQGLGALAIVQSLAFVPGSNTVLAASDNFLVASTDGGQTYTTLWQPGLADGYHVSHVRVAANGTIVLATWGGAAISTDGMTFTRTNVGAMSEYVVDVVPLDATATLLIAVTAAYGVYVSQDGGMTWTASDSGLGDLGDNCIAVLDDGSLLLGTNTGLYRASSFAGPWAPSGLAGTEVDALLVADGAVIAAGVAGVFASQDGASWQVMPGLESAYSEALAIDGTGNLVVGTTGRGLFRAPLP
jgi:hypothetical protein